jgi:hypothetical protein
MQATIGVTAAANRDGPTSCRSSALVFWHEIRSHSHTCSEWSFEKDTDGLTLAAP